MICQQIFYWIVKYMAKINQFSLRKIKKDRVSSIMKIIITLKLLIK